MEIFLLMACFAAVKTEPCTPMYTQAHFKLHNTVLKTIRSDSSSECLSQCSLNDNCVSINYEQSQTKCELNQGNHISHPGDMFPASGYTYIQVPGKVPHKCSDKYCSEPFSCVTKGEDYECVSACEASGKREVMIFPRKSTSDYVELETHQSSPLTELTVSFWAQLTTGSTYQAMFSYSGETVSANTILIQATDTDITIMIGGDRSEPAVTIMDGFFHHIALTWSSSDGKWVLYINGTRKGEDKLSEGKDIPKGVVILGQDQDSYKGGFEQEQSLQGNLTDVNMWDKVLSDQEIADQYTKKCSTVQGNFVKWLDLVQKIKGLVEIECRSFCR